MKCHYLIFTLCIFVFTTYKIVQGMFLYDLHENVNTNANSFNSNNNYPSSPPGYHYASLSEVQQNYDPNSYDILPLGHALSLYTFGRGTTPSSGTGARRAGARNINRTKRGYYPFSIPYLTENPTPASTTATGTTTTTTADTAKDVSTKTVDGVSSVVNTAKADSTAVTKTTAVAENQGFLVNAGKQALHFFGFGESIKNDGSGYANAAITSTTGTVKTLGTKAEGIVTNAASDVSTVVSMGEDLEQAMVLISPYLPLVYKVAIVVLPGLTPYQTLQLTWQIAKIITEALKNYEEGESLARVTTVAAAKIAYDAYLRKRDTGATITTITEDTTVTESPAVSSAATATITGYATNALETIKNMFGSHVGISPLSIFSGTNSNSSPDNNKIVYDKHGKMVHFVAPETKSSSLLKYLENGAGIFHLPDNKMQLHEPSWKLNKIRGLDNMVPKLHINSESPSDDDDTVNEGKVLKTDDNVLGNMLDIDKTRFEELLNKSMKYQPSFIRDTDPKVLVQFLRDKTSKIPPSTKVDPGRSLTAFTSTMTFGKDVTDDQIADLVDILSKSTDYFILKSIHGKNTGNRIKS